VAVTSDDDFLRKSLTKVTVTLFLIKSKDDHSHGGKMTIETITPAPRQQEKKTVYRGGASETVYGLGFLGALVYYIGHATSLWIGLLGLLKAVFWPAVLVYEALSFFGG
jgi:hypothetical protein